MRPLRRPPISRHVLNSIAQRLRADDPYPPSRATQWLSSFSGHLLSWFLLLWLIVIIAAPLLLLALIAGINYTGIWVVIAGWLLFISATLGLLLLIITMVVHKLCDKRPIDRRKLLIAAVGVPALLFLIWYIVTPVSYPLPPHVQIIRLMGGTMFTIVIVASALYDALTHTLVSRGLRLARGAAGCITGGTFYAYWIISTTTPLSADWARDWMLWFYVIHLVAWPLYMLSWVALQRAAQASKQRAQAPQAA